MPLDIVLPYYGSVEHMQIAVRSILAQDDPDWRLLVVDDGYPDESIPGWFAGLGDARVSYQRNEQNLGANENYRKGLGLVETDWFVMMGADDIMHPAYVRRVKALIERFPDAGFIHPGVETIDEHGAPTSGAIERAKRMYRPAGEGARLVAGEDVALSLAKGNWMYFPAICWRTAAVRAVGFRHGLNVVQDLALAYDVITAGHPVAIDDDIVFSYRRHSASDSSVRALSGSRFTEEGDFFRSMAATFESLGWRRAAKASRRHWSSRMNAALLLPKALRHNRDGARVLWRHVVGA